MAGTMQCKAAGRVGTKSVRAGRRVNGRRGNACRVQASAASSGGRRELLGVLIGAAGAAGAALVQPATAYEEYNKYIKPTGKNGATSIGIQDMRKKNAGVQLIYEARDVDLPLKDRYVFSRDAEAGKEMTPETTLKRISDARGRIDGEVRTAIAGSDWVKARNALRGRVGFLRFDLNYLVSLKDKSTKKEAVKLKTSALQKIEDLDFQLRQKDQASSEKKIEIALAELDKAVSFLK